MASGEKMQDDAKLLKKAIKRIDKKKEKSKQQWQDRADTVKTQEEDRQRKRTDNLAKRKQDNKNRKLGIKEKKSAGPSKKKSTSKFQPNTKKKDKYKPRRAGFEGK